MSDKGIRDDLRYNTTNMGELGKFIRLEHVYSILDRYIIMGKNADAELELGRIGEIRELLTHAPDMDLRQTLERIYRIVNP